MRVKFRMRRSLRFDLEEMKDARTNTSNYITRHYDSINTEITRNEFNHIALYYLNTLLFLL